MRIRSPYHIHLEKSDLGGVEIKIWVNNLFGVPTYNQIVGAVDGKITCDIGALVQSLVPKDGFGVKVRYRVDAFDTNNDFVKTWQKEYRAFYGYNLFAEGGQVDYEKTLLDGINNFDITTGTLVGNDFENPWGEEIATKIDGVNNNIQLQMLQGSLVPSANFSMFFLFAEGTTQMTVQHGGGSVTLDVIISDIAGNSINVTSINNMQVKALQVGKFTDINGNGYIYIEFFNENSNGSLVEISIQTDEAYIYSPSLQSYFQPEGLEQLLKSTNKELIWKQGVPITVAASLNAEKRLDSFTPIGFIFKDGTTGSIATTVGQLYFTQDSIKQVETVQFNIANGDNVLIPVTYLPCTKQDIKKVDFINRFGIKQSLFFSGANRVTEQTTAENYRANILSNGGYSTQSAQYRNFNVTGKEQIIINSGFYPESFNDVFSELFLAERIWIEDLPATITSRNFSRLTRLNDDLINYEVTFEFANDIISNVR